MQRQPRPFTEAGWSDAARERGLFFDLSHIEWFELGALVQVCLLVESARRSGIAVTVALPLDRFRRSEEHAADSLSGLPEGVRNAIHRRREARRRSRRFLVRVEFEAALRPEHLTASGGSLTVLDEFDISTVGDSPPVHELWEQSPDEEPPPAGRRPVAFPLTWMTTEHSQLDRYAKQLSKVLIAELSDETRGIDRVSADALSNVVLFELVDNAIRYGKSPRALVAAWARPAKVVLAVDDYLPGERGFVEWSAKQDRSAIELVIGDSGRGIPRVLAPAYEATQRRKEPVPELGQGIDASVLAWSFDRYSTSEEDGKDDRGTRGLFRVDRVVKKHAGLIGIRSAAELVGWDHGGAAHDARFTAGQRLASVPGTLVRVQLPSMRERFVSRPLPRLPASRLSFRVTQLEATEEGEVTPKSSSRLRTSFRKTGDGPVGHIVVLPQGVREHGQVLALLRDVAGLRDPGSGAVAVVALGDWDVVRNASEALDALIAKDSFHTESAKATHFEISDPLLLIGTHTGELASQRLDSEPRQVRWVAAPQSTREVLERLSAAEDRRLSWDEFDGLDLGDEREAVLQALRLDTSLVALDDDGLSLRLHEDAILDHVAGAVLAHIEEKSGRFGSDEVAITPSLMRVHSWLEPPSLIPPSVGDALSMVCLARQLRQEIAWSQEGHPEVVVTGAGVEQSRVDHLMASLGIEKKKGMAPDSSSEPPEDLQVLAPGQNALLYADIVASGESAQRVLRHILRDGSRPVAVACGLDARDDPTQPLVAWGLEVPIVSLAQMPLRAGGSSPEATKVYIGPQGGIEDQDEQAQPASSYSIEPPALRKLVEEHDALHFGHTGSHGGLHFTFYVNSKALLTEFSLALEDEVEQWRSEAAIERADRVEVWYPMPEPKVAGPARQLAEMLDGQREDVVRATPIGREAGWGTWNIREKAESLADRQAVQGERDVVIIDWGSLKGNTLMGMLRLAAHSGARRVLACVCLSQLPKESERLLTSIREVRGSASKLDDDSPSPPRQQLEIGQRPPKQIRVEQDVDVQVKFLSTLPVPAFTPVECPVCQQLSQISRQKFASENLNEFAEEQSSGRLKLLEREDTVSKKPIDLDGMPLRGANAVRMLVDRDQLEEALRSTRGREQIQGWIESLSSEGSRREEVVDLMRLLAIETHWLRRPPLSFTDLKERIARLAGDLACDGSLPAGDRVNAVAVLRTCSKSHFAERAAAVYASALTDEKISRQLLYGVHTYLEPDYRDTPKMVDTIARALEEMSRCIRREGGNRAAVGGEDISHLENRAVFLARRADQWELSLADAWYTLKKELNDAVAPHKGILQLNLDYLDGRVYWYIVKRLIDGEEIDETEGRTLKFWLDNLQATWSHIENFLVDKMVPALGRLEGLLRTTSAREALGDVAIPLLDLIEREVPGQEWEIAKLSRDLGAGRRRVEDPNVWQSFESECEFLIEGLLEPGEGPKGEVESSRLNQLLNSVPSQLPETVEAIARQHTASEWIAEIDTSGMDGIDSSVFYPASALRRLMTELLKNVVRHHKEGNFPGPPEQPATVWISTRADADSVVLEVRNNETKSSSRVGEGLKELERELAAFEGSIERLDERDLGDDPEATFKVLVTLKRGQE